MAIRKERNKHLTDDQRLALEAALRERKPFAQVSRETGIPRSTIRREVTSRRVESTKTSCGRRFNPCARRDRCDAAGMCGRPDEPHCQLRKQYYLHRVAHEGYRRTLTEARRGVNLTEGELRALDEALVPALARGQSVHHAMAASPASFAVCERTVCLRLRQRGRPVLEAAQPPDGRALQEAQGGARRAQGRPPLHGGTLVEGLPGLPGREPRRAGPAGRHRRGRQGRQARPADGHVPGVGLHVREAPAGEVRAARRRRVRLDVAHARGRDVPAAVPGRAQGQRRCRGATPPAARPTRGSPSSTARRSRGSSVSSRSRSGR